jgi:hypothetical protein
MILVAFLFPGSPFEVTIDHKSKCRGKNQQDKEQEDERGHNTIPFCVIQPYVCLNTGEYDEKESYISSVCDRYDTLSAQITRARGKGL